MQDTRFSFAGALLSTVVAFGVSAVPATAQGFVLGGGVSTGSVPRAMAPLCASARRLSGPGFSASAGYVSRRVRLSANLDHVRTLSISVAGCLPGSGIAVDSAFAPADNSAFTLSAAGWLPVAGPLDLGLETGWVPDHSSWFIGPGIAAQYGYVRAEFVGRLHLTSFDEITRDFGASPVRVLSRRDLAESSWGFSARILLLTRRRQTS